MCLNLVGQLIARRQAHTPRLEQLDDLVRLKVDLTTRHVPRPPHPVLGKTRESSSVGKVKTFSSGPNPRERSQRGAPNAPEPEAPAALPLCGRCRRRAAAARCARHHRMPRRCAHAPALPHIVAGIVAALWHAGNHPCPGCSACCRMPACSRSLRAPARHRAIARSRPPSPIS